MSSSNKVHGYNHPFFKASFDYGFGQYGLGSYLYDYSTMRVILFIPDEEDKTFPFIIRHRQYPLNK